MAPADYITAGAPPALTALPVALDTSASHATATTPPLHVKRRLPPPATHPPLPTPVKILRLAALLQGYDHQIKQYLLDGFTAGFKVGFHGPLPPPCGRNLISAQQLPDVVSAKLNKELEAGRLAGPFPTPPLPQFCTSPIGLVEKRREPGQYRLIHHLSHPRDSNSINSGIPADFATVQYATVDDAVKLIQRLGKGCYLAKTDIKSAFRLIPVHPSDYHLFGFSFQGSYFFDKCLPFGASSSCRIFETFSSALEWAAKHKLGIEALIHIIDDFLFGARTKEACNQNLISFLACCRHLGVPTVVDKTLGPHQIMIFAGLELDTVDFQVRLPAEKLKKCRDAIASLENRASVGLRELQSVIGLLQYCCTAVVPGRAYLRRLINLTIGVRRPHFRIRLNQQARADLMAWKFFLDQFNGRVFFLPSHWQSSPSLELYTDAAGAVGYGAVFNNQWFHGLWPVSWKRECITLLELYPIIAALAAWGPQLANKRINFRTDNMAVVHIINSCTSKDRRIMTLVRRFVLLSMSFNIHFKASHVSGTLNYLADSLSRQQVSTFHQMAPWAQPHPTPLPPSILPVTFNLGF